MYHTLNFLLTISLFILIIISFRLIIEISYSKRLKKKTKKLKSKILFLEVSHAEELADNKKRIIVEPRGVFTNYAGTTKQNDKFKTIN